MLIVNEPWCVQKGAKQVSQRCQWKSAQQSSEYFYTKRKYIENDNLQTDNLLSIIEKIVTKLKYCINVKAKEFDVKYKGSKRTTNHKTKLWGHCVK